MRDRENILWARRCATTMSGPICALRTLWPRCPAARVTYRIEVPGLFVGPLPQDIRLTMRIGIDRMANLVCVATTDRNRASPGGQN